MNKILLITAIFFSMIQAKATELTSELKHFTIANGKFNRGQAYAFDKNTTVTIDYNQNLVYLIQYSYTVCNPGEMCTNSIMMDKKLVLPITQITNGECHSRKVVAFKDARPVDGALEQVVIDDRSENTCPTFAYEYSKIKFTTVFFDRMNGKLVRLNSTANLKYVP